MKDRNLICSVTSLLLVASMFLLSGCGTCLRGQMDGVYRGCKIDIGSLFVGISSDSIVREVHMNLAGEAVVRTGYVVASIVDLPISVVTDTLCLPYDLKQISKYKASMRPCAQTLSKIIPAGAEVLDQPEDVADPCALGPYPPIVTQEGGGVDGSITGITGSEKRYRYPGVPGTRLVVYEIVDSKRESHVLVLRVRNWQQQEMHNNPAHATGKPAPDR